MTADEGMRELAVVCENMHGRKDLQEGARTCKGMQCHSIALEVMQRCVRMCESI